MIEIGMPEVGSRMLRLGVRSETPIAPRAVLFDGIGDNIELVVPSLLRSRVSRHE